MPLRVANKNASLYVNNRDEFKGSNTWGEQVDRDTYAVFSYGTHFPMYIYRFGEWIGNSDKYSPSTSKHQTQLRPDEVDVWLDTQQMQKFLHD